MGKFVNSNGVTFNVADEKDERYEADPAFESVSGAKKAPAKKAASSKSSN